MLLHQFPSAVTGYLLRPFCQRCIRPFSFLNYPGTLVVHFLRSFVTFYLLSSFVWQEPDIQSFFDSFNTLVLFSFVIPVVHALFRYHPLPLRIRRWSYNAWFSLCTGLSRCNLARLSHFTLPYISIIDWRQRAQGKQCSITTLTRV